MSTSTERENRRIFQKYLTSILFNGKIADTIESICNDIHCTHVA